ncbi:hypothetical protein SCP_0900600 [Sparassis crispa]|uniref:Uncharacterized protein n=1 Tax=Sparassis crispa TaxID=139825 RepID=A0A401GVF3_9APHY|nr:hypothetical protein SCP_0900600 [Sparassis crispa]GBE86182.1 hypothetical protein SCP_0900600 [Sparassis crispa]
MTAREVVACVSSTDGIAACICASGVDPPEPKASPPLPPGIGIVYFDLAAKMLTEETGLTNIGSILIVVMCAPWI